MWQEIKHISTTNSQVRKFGWLVGGVLVLIGAYHYFFGDSALVMVGAVGLAVALGASIIPSLFRPIYWLWMLIAVVLGWVMSRVILTILFYLVVTPIGLIGKIAGKRFLSLNSDHDAATYWERREPQDDPTRCEKQF